MRAGHSNIKNFYNNRSVLISGGSGFIGKVLIEKLLRVCTGIRHIFVLIRPKRNKQPQERLQELLKVPLFDGYDYEMLQEKVIVVEGDVTYSNLGLSDQNLLKIMNEVSVIFHSAATVKFDEPLKQSVGINIAGTKNMIDVCRKIPQLAALVHVSTAYANCDRDEIDEFAYPVDMDPEKLIEMASWLDQDTLQELKTRLLGEKPNTYTYTKALAEWLLIKSARDLPVVICRPSIVAASWREPFSGWIDNVNGPTGILLGTGKGLIRSMYAESSCVADLVPVDTVINLIVTLGWFAHVYSNHKQPSDVSDSLSDSLISSESMSGIDDDSFNANFNGPIKSLEEPSVGSPDGALNNQSIGGRANGNDKHYGNDNNNKNNNHSNNNNNDTYNNNSNGLHRPYGMAVNNYGRLDSGKGSAMDEGNLFDLYHQTNGNMHHLQPFTDDGYASSTILSPSVSSSSSSLSKRATSSTSDTSALLNNGIKDDIDIDDQQDQGLMSYVTQRRLDEQKQGAFEYKLKQFRHNIQTKLNVKNLPDDLADIPVFHCTSGFENPITWGRIQILMMTILTCFPSISTYRYPNGAFTNNERLDAFYRITLHYLPAYIVDFVTQLFGGKPILVRIFKKYDQAAGVLKAFTSREWKFSADNRIWLLDELMSEEDKRLFNCDLRELEWTSYLEHYVQGVRQYILKEPRSNLEQARKNLRVVYYRNLALQMLLVGFFLYYFITLLFSRT